MSWGECRHDYRFLRQESSYDDSTTDVVTITEDVFYCTDCLKYARKEVERRSSVRGIVPHSDNVKEC